MLQISQTEKPTCSAKIDQIRVRSAMNLPLASQNFSSSGSHSEIQVEPGSGRRAGPGAAGEVLAFMRKLHRKKKPLADPHVCDGQSAALLDAGALVGPGMDRRESIHSDS